MGAQQGNAKREGSRWRNAGPADLHGSGGQKGGKADMEMAKVDEPITIKKYANRRLYNTGTSAYVTLEDLADMLKAGEDFVVYDAKSGDDITRSVLTQIIFELESKGPNLLPIAFLRQLIRFYGDSMQTMVPTYLDFSIESLVGQQEKLRSQMTQAFGSSPIDLMRENVRRNSEMFEKAMRMFMPFAQPGGGGAAAASEAMAAGKKDAPSSDDIEALKKQINEMRDKLDKMSGGR